ncbi:quaternary amine ABC transporter ATP-binding protein [Pseudonocardia nigra]|uniref:quaternary amine ABC transporter ATP-binding protein n=1 Tax=Pseudonocardia nigra TaxID=1921578 RepID=UPI001FE3285B|nr:betaine/proline/choline family ABC transporter ATP-binding protein [Pseudonocardia nigra]
MSNTVGEVMIEAKGLSKAYGLSAQQAEPMLRADDARAAVRDAGGFLGADEVDLTVERGELFVIMGLSGSGKSTVLRMINRLVEPTSGALSVDGQDVLGMDDDQLYDLRNQKISMVFQHFALFPHRTVRENAAYGLQVRGLSARERLDRADRALDRVGLGDRGDAYPHELSGGMKQRVGLARALATDADVLLMDEPFSALDPLIKRDMQELLLKLQAEDQRTIVFVTHDLNEAMRIGHRIMVMKDGQVVQCGTGEEILSEPADDYVSNFVADVDRSRVLTAGTLLRPPLLTARPDEKPGDVLRRLEHTEMNGLFVVDDAGRLHGVAQDDLLADAARRGDPDVRRCLVHDYETVSADVPIVDFCHLAGRHIVPVAVVDADRRLLGVVPRAAILSAMARTEEGAR